MYYLEVDQRKDWKLKDPSPELSLLLGKTGL